MGPFLGGLLGPCISYVDSLRVPTKGSIRVREELETGPYKGLVAGSISKRALFCVFCNGSALFLSGVDRFWLLTEGNCFRLFRAAVIQKLRKSIQNRSLESNAEAL